MFKPSAHFLLAASLTLTGCATSTPPSMPQIPSLDTSLARDCPTLTKPAQDYDAWLIWTVDVLKLYGECAARHHATVAAWPKSDVKPAFNWWDRNFGH